MTGNTSPAEAWGSATARFVAGSRGASTLRGGHSVRPRIVYSRSDRYPVLILLHERSSCRSIRKAYRTQSSRLLLVVTLIAPNDLPDRPGLMPSSAALY